MSAYSSALDHSVFIIRAGAWPVRRMCTCMLFSQYSQPQPLRDSPMAGFRITARQYSPLSLPSTLLSPLFHLTLCISPDRSHFSSLWFLGFAGMSPPLQSSNQFPPESVTSHLTSRLFLASFSELCINFMCLFFIFFYMLHNSVTYLTCLCSSVVASFFLCASCTFFFL